MKYNLVRKKLKWNYKPFEIKHIIQEWRRIGKNSFSKIIKKKNQIIDKKIINIIKQEKKII